MVTLLSLFYRPPCLRRSNICLFARPNRHGQACCNAGARPTDVDRTDTDEPDAPGRTRREYCYNILVSGLDDDNGGSDTNILVRFDVANKRIDLVESPCAIRCCTMITATTSSTSPYAKGGTELR